SRCEASGRHVVTCKTCLPAATPREGMPPSAATPREGMPPWFPTRSSLPLPPPATMSELDQYDYELPRHLIAQQPVPSRVDARLLVVDRKQQSLAHHHIRDLPEILRPGDCLVLNDTRVVPARLLGRRDSTG